MTKQELLDILDNYRESPELALIIKLIKGTEESDPDFSLALEHGTALQIINLFLDCYTSKDLLDWLAKHNFDLFVDYRFSDYEYLDDIEDEEERQEKIDNALFYNEETGIIVHSW